MTLRGRWRRGDATPWGTMRFTGAGGAEWVPPATRAEESAGLYSFHPESQVYMAMDVDAYMDLVERVWLHERRPTAGSTAIAARFEAGEVVDAAFLDVEVDAAGGLRPISQEGSHRAVEARRLGIRTIPVLVYLRDGYGYGAVGPSVRHELRAWGTVVR